MKKIKTNQMLLIALLASAGAIAGCGGSGGGTDNGGGGGTDDGGGGGTDDGGGGGTDDGGGGSTDNGGGGGTDDGSDIPIYDSSGTRRNYACNYNMRFSSCLTYTKNVASSKYTINPAREFYEGYGYDPCRESTYIIGSLQSSPENRDMSELPTSNDPVGACILNWNESNTPDEKYGEQGVYVNAEVFDGSTAEFTGDTGGGNNEPSRLVTNTPLVTSDGSNLILDPGAFEATHCIGRSSAQVPFEGIVYYLHNNCNFRIYVAHCYIGGVDKFDRPLSSPCGYEPFNFGGLSFNKYSRGASAMEPNSRNPIINDLRDTNFEVKVGACGTTTDLKRPSAAMISPSQHICYISRTSGSR